MIEVSGIRVPLSKLDGTDSREKVVIRQALARRLHVRQEELGRVTRRKRSIDARKKGDIQLIFTLRAELPGGASAEKALLARLASKREGGGVRVVEAADRDFPLPLAHAPHDQGSIIVVGAGCAGLFCALSLARAGLEPLLVERGDDAARRSRVVRHHDETGELDPESNIQFGVGGAGTFSDGKLQTGTKSPFHRLVLKTFADAGAQQRILWDAKPHIGSDVLPGVVTRIIGMIEEAGGTVRCRCRLVDLDVSGGRVHAVTLRSEDPETGIVTEERMPCSKVVLACGHSARDVFELLVQRGVPMERKTFAMGVRIEHLQADIDRALYGPSAGNPVLGAAPYSLAVHLPSGRSAFSFCMCPGGYVVSAANEPGGVVTNGMSYSDRAGENANSGLLANVFPEDLPGDDVLEGVKLQRACERAAFEAGGGGFVAPAQLVGDFLHGRPSAEGGGVEPTYPRGVSWGDVSRCLPSYITETLRAAIPEMGRKLRGFDRPDAVLTGVETRSSSPVRVTRGDNLQSVGVRGLWPVGEGAGYAGGIMSAAADGLRVAEAVVADAAEELGA
ncbi:MULTISPECIES: FAD-dependent oxidoreductase [Atopobiaceae]|uniref:FAD-binding protein n=1 Tax=Tractidigestivibacter montrealensis TaxID=2972466 RepID=A0ABT1Z705_9ACTN|nr:MULTISPECIES: FAD-dependent oxidoreductase [Atopobiaceae]MCR9035992.1 FAD-binding protein [Tractidigestivibacter montrealensis]